MTFGEVPVDAAEGGILAHSLRLTSGVLKKGTVLTTADLEALRASEYSSVVVAMLGDDDVSEDVAALRIATRLIGDGLCLGPAFTGRVNVIAERAGLVRIDTLAVEALNRIDEGMTLATLSDLMRVEADQLVGTVKIIPYALPEAVVVAGEACFRNAALTLMPFRGGSARLVMTRTPGFKDSLLTKGEAVVRTRLAALGFELDDVVVVPHQTDAVAGAVIAGVDLTLILGASATSDRGDVAPAGVIAAGGAISRFGMPVDPGNLLFLGDIGGAPVVGLPGCARSPALNGVDWVLERISAGLQVTAEDVAQMGVGGLLKEMPDRPQPRRPKR